MSQRAAEEASSFAQSSKVYANVAGGFAVGPDGTSGDILGEVGVVADVGYRVSRVSSDTPLNAQSVTFGVGYRF